ncbi:cell division protein FtsA, partial [Candidatus Omnitrophota bacterium]
MRRPQTITGLDIGSSKICAAQAEPDKDGSLRVLGFSSSPSKGIRRGSIVDLDEAVDSISKAMEALKDKTRKRPDNIWLSLSGKTVEAQESRGMVRLSLRGREITRRDITKCVDAAGTIKLPLHRDMVHRVVQAFYVDDDVEVKNPFGLYGSRLAAKVMTVTANASHVQNIQKAVSNSGYDPKEFIFSGLADGAILLGPEDRQKCVALLNIGSSLTELSVFANGVLADVMIIPFGVEDISGAPENDRNFIRARSEIGKRIGRFQKEQEDCREVVLTGGVTLVDGIFESLEKELNLPVRTGSVKSISGNISTYEKVMATTCLGLIKYAFEQYDAGAPAKGAGLISASLSR